MQKSEPDVLYVVETKDAVYLANRKLEATYKHVEFRYGKAKYKEVLASKYRVPEGKEVIWLTANEDR